MCCLYIKPGEYFYIVVYVRDLLKLNAVSRVYIKTLKLCPLDEKYDNSCLAIIKGYKWIYLIGVTNSSDLYYTTVLDFLMKLQAT